jgi:hypothetical protein
MEYSGEKLESLLSLNSAGYLSGVPHANTGIEPPKVNPQLLPKMFFLLTIRVANGPGSSVSIVSGYGLEDWAIEIRYPAEAKGIFL